MKKNEIRLSDNVFGLFSTRADEVFYKISNNTYFTANDKKGPGEGILLSQDIVLGKEYDIYER